MKSMLWKTIAVAVACVAAATLLAGSVQAQELPSFPLIFSGQVTIEGQPTPDGLQIFARVLEYESNPVEVKDGNYSALAVAPSRSGYVGRPIRFYATYGFGEVQAVEMVTYRTPTLEDFTRTRSLFFQSLPAPPPTPTPSPTPTMTPTPTPALPIPGDPMVATVWAWALAVGALGLVGGLVAMRLARTR